METAAPGPQIPDSIVVKANQIVVSRVGADVFSRFYSFDHTRSRYFEANAWCIEHPSSCSPYLQHPHYYVVYALETDGRTPDAVGQFVVDVSGNLFTEPEFYGIPNCIEGPGECVFIDEAAAKQVAWRAGLESGIRAWKVHFHWFAGARQTFVWTVSNTLTATGPPDHRSGGRTVLIDANSGNVLDIFDWIEIS